jgi:hypothetical protein
MVMLKELEEWAEDLKPILLDINICLNNIRILQNEGFDKIRRNYFDNYLVLMYQQHFILNIQLAKIYSTKNKTHKRNIHKILNKLQNEGSYCLGSFKNREELLIVLKDLKEKIQLKAELINFIINNRDTVFAHSDPQDLYKKIELEEYTAIVDLSNEVYNKLFVKLLEDEFNPNFGNKYDLRFIADLLV